MAWYEKGSLLDKFIKTLDKWAGNTTEPNFEELTKTELEEYGRTIGIELDRRKKKATLIKELHLARGE